MADIVSGTARKDQSKRLAAFEGLDEKLVMDLYRMAPVRRLNADEELIHEGDTDQTVYIILDGSILVTKRVHGNEETIATLEEGDWVGEIAFTRSIPRTASAMAVQSSSVMAIDKKTIEALDPIIQLFIYRKLNDLAAQRIADLSARENELAGKNLMLMNYIQSGLGRGRANYASSEMILGLIRKMPKLPAYALDLTSKVFDEHFPPNAISESIKEDRDVRVLLLKRINGPFYGFEKKTEDIHQAIAVLGLNEVQQLIVSEGLRKTIPDSPNFRRLYNRSIALSRLAFSISQETRIGQPIQAALFGLLHGVGQSVLELLKEKNPTLIVLIEALDPAQIGCLMLREWGLPPLICRAVEFQQFPEFSPPNMIPEDVQDLAALLYWAQLSYYHLLRRDPEDRATTFFDEYAAYLGWSKMSLPEVVETRLRPILLKKASTYPAALRKLVSKPPAGKKQAPGKPRASQPAESH